jgi:acetylornithine deacetylase/succinyl-diaminopimelate desuccinylase-like protein
MDRNSTDIAHHPVQLLQQLIRFDTTNPPGDEEECIRYITTILSEAGINSTIIAKDSARPNLIARIPGRGEASPLLVYAHVDVVTTENQTWKYPPFEAQIADGNIWGRGALDDKDGAVMSICAILRMKEDGWSPPGDVVLAIVCDEEQGGSYGSRFLIEDHPDLFTGIRYAIGETGGFTFYIGKQKFYPIMVAEKQFCWLSIILRGPAYYATALVKRHGTAAKAGALLTQMDKGRLPVHVTPVIRQMIKAISANMPLPNSLVMRQLLNPALTDGILGLLGPQGQAMFPLLHNTCAVIGISGGEQVIATPAKIVVNVALGLLPGCSLEDAIEEIREMTGAEFEFNVLHSVEPEPENPDMGLYDTLCQILREADPQGIPMPLMLTAPTDARLYNRLGIQTYGFQPVKLPTDIQVEQLVHAADERIPVEALEFGTNAIYKLLQRFS